MKKGILLLILFIATNFYSQSQEIPKWLIQEWEYLTNGAGVWETDNAEYKNESESYDKYRLEWKYGIGKKSIKGKLYGLKEGKNIGTFWEFRTFWHPNEKKAFTEQFGSDGTYGIGKLSINEGEMIKMLQSFYSPNGLSYKVGHESRTNAVEHKTTSYQIDEAGVWKKNRTYVWKPVLLEETAISQIDTLQSGELMLKQDIIINTNIDRVWKAFSEPEEWKKWVTPVVEMDFKINGTIKSNYEPTAKIGDKGTIIIHILSYVPEKQIVMQAELNENFPEFVKGEEKNLYSIFDFEPINKNQTKVTIYGLGYKNEKRWQDLLKFFIQGNELSLNNLKKYLEQK